jgi:hypothetical protein
MKKENVDKMITFIKKDKVGTLLKALLDSNNETREFDFQVDVFTTGDVRLYSPKLREWLNGK